MSARSNLTVAGLALAGAIMFTSASAFAQSAGGGGGGGAGGSGASASAPGVEMLVLERNQRGPTFGRYKLRPRLPGCGDELPRVDAFIEECDK